MPNLVDDLVEAVLSEPKTSSGMTKEAAEAPRASSEWEMLADELEKQASIVDAPAETPAPVSDVRMRKLAMAAILDTLDDPKHQSAIMSIDNEAHEIMKSALAQPDPGSVGELAQATNSDGPAYLKHKVGKGRTLFEKMNTNIAATSTGAMEGKA